MMVENDGDALLKILVSIILLDLFDLVTILLKRLKAIHIELSAGYP